MEMKETVNPLYSVNWSSSSDAVYIIRKCILSYWQEIIGRWDMLFGTFFKEGRDAFSESTISYSLIQRGCIYCSLKQQKIPSSLESASISLIHCLIKSLLRSSIS